MKKILLTACVIGAIPMSLPVEAAPRTQQNPALTACVRECQVQREKNIAICRAEMRSNPSFRGQPIEDALCRNVTTIVNIMNRCRDGCFVKFQHR